MTSYTSIIAYALTSCFSVIIHLITPSRELGGPFLTLSSEPQRFGLPTRRATNDHPAPHFQRAEAMAEIALVPVEGAHQCLVAACDPALRPLVIGGQPT